jgi:endonuclease/exonuclease/phosphatase family metal-dependent hydrolase
MAMTTLAAFVLLRVATYNVHSCRGLDFRMTPARIAKVAASTGADVIALEEVRAGQADEIASRLGFFHVFGEADVLGGYPFGNAILTRYPIVSSHNYAIGVPKREQRACIRADIELAPGRIAHVFAVHLGLSSAERRYQVSRLLSPEILGSSEIAGTLILLGDFNEFFDGGVDRTIRSRLDRVDKRTYPGLLPLFGIDRIYFDAAITVTAMRLKRSFRALFASDHVPLIGDLNIPE